MSLLIAQINPTIGDFSGNLKRMLIQAGAAGEGDAIFFALGSISGYLRHMPDRDFLTQGIQGLAELARRLPHTTIASAYWDIDGVPTIFISQQGVVRHVPQPRTMLRFNNQHIVLSLTPPDNPATLDEDFFVYLQPIPFNLQPLPQISPSNYIYGWANLVGGQDSLVFQGASQWLKPQGEELRAPGWQEGVIALTSQRCESVDNPLASMHRALLVGIADYVNKNCFPSVILGLSGGVDSALVALLAVQALGAHRVHALTMPSPYSSNDTLQDAHYLAANLGISLQEIPIEPAMKLINQCLWPLLGDGPPGVEQENMQARIRSLLLMTLANRHNHLLLSTSNRSESMVGYATLYGDMSGGLAPIADLYKTEVYLLCDYLDPKHQIIPESTITRAPSAELRPNQTDQDSLPPYAQLDMILQQLSEDGLSSQHLLNQGVDGKVLKKTVALMAGSQFKREQAPPKLHMRSTPVHLPLTNIRNYLAL